MDIIKKITISENGYEKYYSLIYELAQIIIKNHKKETDIHYVESFSKEESLLYVLNFLDSINSEYYDLLLDFFDANRIIEIRTNNPSFLFKELKIELYNSENLERAFSLIHEFIHYSNAYKSIDFKNDHFLLSETFSNTFELLLANFLKNLKDSKLNYYKTANNSYTASLLFLYMYNRMLNKIGPNLLYDNYILSGKFPSIDNCITYILGNTLSTYMYDKLRINNIIKYNNDLKNISFLELLKEVNIEYDGHNLSNKSLEDIKKSYIKISR